MSKKLGHNDTFDQFINGCIVCGKEVKNEEYLVEINYVNGNIWSAAEPECETSQGAFVVGSGCASKFAAGVLTKIGG